MTEPENYPAAGSPDVAGVASSVDSAQLSTPGAGQVVDPPGPGTPDFGETVLCTDSPHVFHASPEHIITPQGTPVPTDKVLEYVESADRYGVRVFEKGA